MPDKWVTVKVPEAEREQARDYKPGGVTWGECLVAGAERLNEHLDSDPPAGVSEEQVPAGFLEVQEATEEELKEIKRRMESIETVEERTGRIERLLEDMDEGLRGNI